MLLPHRALERFGEAAVVLAELRVAPGPLAGMFGLVFLPQQHQRDAFAAQLLVDAPKVGHGEVGLTFRTAKQATLQCRLIHLADGRPVQARRRGQANVLGNDAL